MGEREILVIKKDKGSEKINIKITDKRTNGWAPNKYEKVIGGKDPNDLAFLFYDLDIMDYKVDAAYKIYKYKYKKDKGLWIFEKK